MNLIEFNRTSRFLAINDDRRQLCLIPDGQGWNANKCFFQQLELIKKESVIVMRYLQFNDEHSGTRTVEEDSFCLVVNVIFDYLVIGVVDDVPIIRGED